MDRDDDLPKLHLRKEQYWSGGKHYSKQFDVKRGDKVIGSVEVRTSYENPRGIFVGGIEGTGPNTLGLHHVRTLGRQLMEHFPGRNEIIGVRDTGARKGKQLTDISFAFR